MTTVGQSTDPSSPNYLEWPGLLKIIGCGNGGDPILHLLPACIYLLLAPLSSHLSTVFINSWWYCRSEGGALWVWKQLVSASGTMTIFITHSSPPADPLPPSFYRQQAGRTSQLCCWDLCWHKPSLPPNHNWPPNKSVAGWINTSLIGRAGGPSNNGLQALLLVPTVIAQSR